MRRLLRCGWFWLSVILLTLLLVGGFLLVASRHTTAITQANCDKIVVGMAEEEVEALLGEPPSGAAGANAVMGAFWLDDEDNMITVEFWGGKVVKKGFSEGHLSTLERIQKMIRRILRPSPARGSSAFVVHLSLPQAP